MPTITENEVTAETSNAASDWLRSFYESEQRIVMAAAGNAPPRSIISGWV